MASATYYAYANGGSQTHYRGKVVFTETNSVANNQSTIAYDFYLYRADGYTGAAHHFTSGNKLVVVINGTTLISSTNYKTVILTGTSESKPLLMCSGTVTIPHNSDGSKSFTFSFAYDQTQNKGQELDYLTVAGTHTCTTIARATTATLSASSVALGNPVTINTNRASDTFTHTLKYSIGSVSETIASNVATSTTFTPSIDLAKQITTSTSGTITITCTTYSGSNIIGTTTTKLTVTVPSSIVPTCSFTLSEASSLPSGITVWVKTKSRIKIAVSASGAYGSTISKYSINANGTPYNSASVTTGYLTTSGENKITVTVTDSRGRQATSTQTITVLDYKLPYLSTVKAYRCDEDGTASDTGNYIRLSLNGAITSLSNQNAKTCVIYYKRDENTTWLSQTVSLSSYTINAITTPFAASGDYAYNLHVKLSDSFTSSNYYMDVSGAFTLGNFNPSGRGIAWGGVSQNDAFEVYMDEYHYGVSEFNDVTFSGNVNGNVRSLNYITNEVAQGDNINDSKYLLPGVWSVRNDIIAASLTNLPTTYAGVLITYSGTGKNNVDTSVSYYYARQEYIPYISLYARYERSICSNAGNDFTYHPWRQVAYTDDITDNSPEISSDTELTVKSVTATGDITTSGDIEAKHIDATSALTTRAGVEIFATNPYIDFHFNSSTGDRTARIAEYSQGILTAENSIVSSSDARLKKDIIEVPEVYLDLVDQISPKLFRFNKCDQYLNIGLIAQEVLEIEKRLGIVESILVRGTGKEIPDPADPTKTVIDYYSIDYNAYNVLKTLSLERKLAKLQATY